MLVGRFYFSQNNGQQSSVRLIIVIIRIVAKDFLIECAVVFDTGINLWRDIDDSIAMNQLTTQFSDQYLIMTQYSIGMHQYRHFSGFMGDEWIAISIAANPRAKTDKGG